jgi:hypothetical protein
LCLTRCSRSRLAVPSLPAGRQGCLVATSSFTASKELAHLQDFYYCLVATSSFTASKELAHLS